jgi:hypothetical protein
MDQQAEHSETAGIQEVGPRLDGEAGQLETTPTPAVEPQGSIFPDPFGEEQTGEPAVQAPSELPRHISLSDDADDPVVDCMLESAYQAQAAPAGGARDRGLAFDLEDESEERSIGLDGLEAELPEDSPAEPEPSVRIFCSTGVPPVFSGQEHSGDGLATDDLPRSLGTATSDTSAPVTPDTGATEPAAMALNRPADESTCAAHIVASALEAIVSGLAGSILQTALSSRAVRSAGPAGVGSHSSTDPAGPASRTVTSGSGKAIGSASPDDDHSYQWHAFQDDDDAAPVEPWGEEAPTPVAAPAGSVAAVDAASREDPNREAASGKSGAPVAYRLPSHHVIPSGSAGASDGTLDYESSADPENADNLVPAGTSRGGGWTIPLLCAGISIIACCLLIPLCDANRRAAFEKLRLRRDLESLQHQVATNDEFLRKVSDDPTLAERLAQRQLRKVRAGMRDVPLKDDAGAGRSKAAFGSMSPFGIVAVAPPGPLAPYQPVGGRIATLCYNPHSRLYLMGAGLMLLAMGLVMGYVPIGGTTRQIQRAGPRSSQDA